MPNPTCPLYVQHTPVPLRLVVHHIQPLGMHGADVPANRTPPICDNCHYGVHRLLGRLILGEPLPRGWTPLAALAQEGYAEWVAAGRPGRPVFELEAERTGVVGFGH